MIRRVRRAIDALVAAGAVGINIEDGAAPPELLAQKIAAINARIPTVRQRTHRRLPARARAAGRTAFTYTGARGGAYTNAGAEPESQTRARPIPRRSVR